MFQRRTHLDRTAVIVLIVLCATWGLQQVVIKVALAGISPLMQAGLRSAIAALLLLAWMHARGIRVLQSDGTLLPGIVAGLLFGIEFCLIYQGLEFTSASRAILFLYMAPFVVVLGVFFLIPGERLNALQVAGMALAFAGVAVVFGEGVLVLPSARAWIGDLMLFGGAVFWGVTTLLIRVSKLSRIEPSRTLFYQLGVSALLLPAASVLLGEPGVFHVTPLIAACIAFQGIVVAFATYLAWFWLIAHYPVQQLSSYTFLTPLFGVLFGVLLLDEVLTAVLIAGATLVGAGIYLVNRRPAKKGSE